jgi:hypothetical protein
MFIFRSDELDDDYEAEEGDSFRRSPSPEGATSRQFKTINGKQKIDMTPPDQLLTIAQKRAHKLSILKKVTVTSFFLINNLLDYFYNAFSLCVL